MSLNFVEPIIWDGEKIIELSKVEIEKENAKWKQAMILYVVGDCPSIRALERFIATTWNFVSKPKIFYHNDGYFVIQLNSIEDRDEVLLSGPYTIGNRPIILKMWSENFDFKAEVLQIVPLWVRLPNLPLNCWGMDSLSRFGSALGVPLYADECTTNIERISYARLLVEMDVTRKLPEKLKVLDLNGKLLEQAVEYDWVPEFCQLV
uniref:Putative ovule protein n=1 Tax=Solanum chacoense TaxID=4108 RepID=A0A0V0H2Y5_SOLCH